MIKKIEAFFTKLGIFNHLAISLVLFIPVSLIVIKLLGPYIGAWWAVNLAYYFREVTHSGGEYNLMKWSRHDRLQTIVLMAGSLVGVFVIELYIEPLLFSI